MIDEVSISNYKSIVRQQFSLGRVNVFVGRSGSGKTNIIEALSLASAAHDDALNSRSLLKRGIRVTKPSLMFHSLQGKQNQCNEIEITWYERNSWKKAKLVCDRADDINTPWKDISWYEPEYIEKINNLIQFIGDGTIEGNYPFADESKNTVLNAAFRGSRNFRDYIMYNINAKKLPDILPQEIFDNLNYDQRQDLKSLGYGDIHAPENLPVLSYLSLFSDKRISPIFAIGNIESLLPPEVCCKLMRFVSRLAVKQNKQAFITTNNPDVVNGLNLKASEPKIFLVKMTENAQTVVEELKDITLLKNIIE